MPERRSVAGSMPASYVPRTAASVYRAAAEL